MSRLLSRFLPWTVALACSTIAEAQRPDSPENGSQEVIVLTQAQLPGDGQERIRLPDFSDSGRDSERKQMVNQQIASRGISNSKVLAALRAAPRHHLVPDSMTRYAYEDRPLPIGHGQTISQPYIVGLMTDLINVDGDDTVLEVGTGSGYQASVLALIAKHVASIEIIEPLARRTADTLNELGYTNLTLLHGDGYFGYEKMAPYDAIIVTAAAEHIPPPLIAQLKPGGTMVIPVGRKGWTQNLLLVEKNAKGRVRSRNILPVRFVPLTRKKR